MAELALKIGTTPTYEDEDILDVCNQRRIKKPIQQTPQNKVDHPMQYLIPAIFFGAVTCEIFLVAMRFFEDIAHSFGG